jgi:hypothetical protein
MPLPEQWPRQHLPKAWHDTHVLGLMSYSTKCPLPLQCNHIHAHLWQCAGP